MEQDDWGQHNNPLLSVMSKCVCIQNHVIFNPKHINHWAVDITFMFSATNLCQMTPTRLRRFHSLLQLHLWSRPAGICVRPYLP